MLIYIIKINKIIIFLKKYEINKLFIYVLDAGFALLSPSDLYPEMPNNLAIQKSSYPIKIYIIKCFLKI